MTTEIAAPDDGFSVSVIIPACNSGWCIARAVQSVLDQSLPAGEIIVVDDGSEDDTSRVVRSFGSAIRYIYQKNAGLPSARNTGAMAARCPWLAFLDADDRWLSGKLESQAKAIRTRPDAGWVFCEARIVDSDGKHLDTWTFSLTSETSTELLLALFSGCVVTGSGSSVAVRRDCFFEAGMFDPRMKAVEDVDLWMRLAARYPFTYAPGMYVEIMRHQRSMSRDIFLMRRYMLKVGQKNRRLLGAGFQASRLWNIAYAGLLCTAGKMALRCGKAGIGSRDLLESALRSPWKWGRTSLAVLAEWLCGAWRYEMTASAADKKVGVVDKVRQRNGRNDVRRIVYIEEGRGFGGAVSILANGLPFLQKMGFETHVVLTYNDTRAVALLRDTCNYLYILPYERRSHNVSNRLKSLKRKNPWLKMPYLLSITVKEFIERGRWLIRLNQLMRQIRPGIVHGNNGPEYNRCAMLLAWLMGFRTVVSVRGPDRRTRLARLVEALCNREVFVSEHLRKAMVPRNSRTVVIYDGLDMQSWAAPESFKCDSNVFRVGHVGMLTPWKGQDVFLRAAGMVAKRYPGVEFYLIGDVIGSDQYAYRETLQRISKDSGYANRIHFMGFQSDIRRVLLGLDVVVHSSISPEPLGTVVLEGMATGRAVIASDEGGPREMIRHGVDGLLVPPRDPRKLAAAIESLLQKPEKKEAFGKSARKRIEQVFTAEIMAKAFASLYIQVIRE